MERERERSNGERERERERERAIEREAEAVWRAALHIDRKSLCTDQYLHKTNRCWYKRASSYRDPSSDQTILIQHQEGLTRRPLPTALNPTQAISNPQAQISTDTRGACFNSRGKNSVVHLIIFFSLLF